MNNQEIALAFLKELKENNHKEWMDANRDKYLHAKKCWLEVVQRILDLLNKHEHNLYSHLEPKDCISRITNNRMYRPEMPIYKDYLTFSVMDKSDIFSPMHLSVGVENSFVGCGYHNPDNQTLKNIRDAIDYEGQVLKDIVENSHFKHFYGGLSNYKERLKTSPKGYAKDHPYVEYLRYKEFTVTKKLTHDEIISNDFFKIIEQAYLISKPFRDFLKKANSI